MVGIIDATNFKGADAVAVVGLKQALSAPVVEQEAHYGYDCKYP